MSKIVLGISGFYHDSAAALVQNGEIIAAAQEERFTRKKHDPRFPLNAINYCLEEAFIETDEIDAIVFYDSQIKTFDRIIKNCMHAGADSLEQFDKATRSLLGSKMWLQDHVKKTIGSLGKINKLLFTEHHMSHAASAFYPSPYEKAAILTVDGVGEWTTTSIGFGNGNNLELLQEIHYPHSLGLLYSTFTYYCGFKVNSGEYKLMGLAPFGEPIYYDIIKNNLIDVKSDGSFRLNMDYFGYMDKMSMTNDKFHDLFGGLPREPESIITIKEMNIAASIQRVIEERIIDLARYAKKETGAKNLVLAGGVALNCVANGKLQQQNIFDGIWIQPAAGDAGGALGAALLVSHQYFDVPRVENISKRDIQKGSYLGVQYSTSEVKAYLDRNNYSYECIVDKAQLSSTIADILASGKIVGYMSGRMEFGPRSLGARSILGDPRNKKTQSIMNLKIKYRESFRPFAPSVLQEDAGDYFDINCESPYMLLVAPVKEDRCNVPDPLGNTNSEDMLKIINQVRSDIPAVTHVDYSARVQTVHRDDKADFYDVIKAFKKKTGYSLLVNTSFNVRGEPIVCSPKDAYTCFMRTEMDVLVLESCILYKEKQPKFVDSDNWKKDYELD
jgi:carbamoyltransferase